MIQPERSFLISGKVIDQQKILHDVEPVIVTKMLPSPINVEIDTMSEVKLVRSSPVPDSGPYILRYDFQVMQHEDQVLIKFGRLIPA